MACFKKYFIISLILALGFFYIHPVQATTGSEGPLVETKKTPSKRTKKKKLKRSSYKKKQKKSTSIKKREKTPSARKSVQAFKEKDRSLEGAVRPLALTDNGSIQNLLENEIVYLKAIRHLLPSDEISLQVYDLKDKKMLVDINGNVIRNAASLIKPFVMLAVYDCIGRQEFQETPEIEHHLHRMIAVSDNAATNYLIRLLGHGDELQGIVAINTLMHKMGFSDTRLRELIPDGGKTYANHTSASDATQFFRLLYEQKLVSPQYSQKMNDILLKNIHDRIKTYQIKQDGIAVADKTGYVRGLNADCGIVYMRNLNGGSDYVLSIIIENKKPPSDGGWGRKKTSVIRYLSNRIYQTMKNGYPKS